MLGTLVNTIAVLIGSIIGLTIKKGIPEQIGDALMKALGLCTIYIGVTGSLKGQNALIIIISMVGGTLIGELLDIDGHVNKWVKDLELKVSHGKDHNLAEGFIAASMLFCVGSMTIVGCLNAGLLNDNTMLYTKSLMDFCASIIFASTLGLGVLASAVFVLVFQGSLVLLAGLLAPLLSTVVINELTCVGSLVIIAVGLNLLKITKLKLMNYIPAIFLPIILCMFM